jgi:glycosyltransferase involved in cell wall biosynthesis
VTAHTPAGEKVLIVDALSGTNDFGVDLCTSLVHRCELTVLTVENTRLDQAHFAGSILRVWPRFGGGTRAVAIGKALRGMVRLMLEIARHRRSVVHSQFPRFYVAEFLAFLLTRPFLKRLVFTAHNAVPHERSSWREALLYLWYRVPHTIVVLSDNVRQDIVRRFNIDPKKIVVIPHGSYVSLREACDGLPVSELVANVIEAMQGRLLIFQFGVIREYKGLDTLIAAARQLPLDSPWHILIMGGGSPVLIESYQGLVRKAGLEARITIIREFLSNPDLAALAERADILTFPYRNISQSGALMLGLTFGKACVCTDIPGFREYVENHEALFFGRGDSTMLAKQIESLLRDRNLRQRLGEAAWNAANGRYGWETVAGRYLRAYGIRRTVHDPVAR